MTFDQAVELLINTPAPVTEISASHGCTWWYIKYRRDAYNVSAYEDDEIVFYEVHAFADGTEVRKDYPVCLEELKDHEVLDAHLWFAPDGGPERVREMDWEFEPGPAGEENDYEACKEYISKRFK